MNKSVNILEKQRSEVSVLKQSNLKQSSYFFESPHNQELKRLFEHYSQMGEASNVQSLRNTKFNKILVHSQIINVSVTYL